MAPLSRILAWADGPVKDGMLRVYDINPPVNEKPVLEYDLHTGKHEFSLGFCMYTETMCGV